jgi:tyrosyl-tRNA synthetase
MTMPLLVGTDGTQKMSQSLGNYIGVDDDAGDMFGKTMSIPDELMGQWLVLAADVSEAEADRLLAAVAGDELHPNSLKRDLARRIVALYWGEDAASAAEEGFDLVHRRKEIPDDIPVIELPDNDPISLPSFMKDAGVATSNGEARRLIQQGAVKVDGIKLRDLEVPRATLVGKVLQVGKRRFVRLR